MAENSAGPATVILLNGTSSSGKSSIAKMLQEKLLPSVYLNFSIDSILYALPPSALKRMTTGQDISDLDYPKLAESYYLCAKALAARGNNLVLDDAVVQDSMASYLMDCMGEFRVLKVGLHCELNELKRREQQRGDRTIGEAEWQFPNIHRHLKYDLELNSTTETPDNLAQKIVEFLRHF